MGRLLLLASYVLCAVVASAAPEEQRVVAQDTLVETLMENLGAEDYTTREQAERALRSIGLPAQSALEKAAQADDPEIYMRARNILSDVMLGIGPEWPEAAIALVRSWDNFDDRQRRNGLRELPQMIGDKAIPFMLLRMEKGSDYEARYALQYLQNYTNNPNGWRRVITLLSEPRCDRHREMLAWAQERSGAPAEALRLLAHVKGADTTRHTAVRKSVKQLVAQLQQGQAADVCATAKQLAGTAPAEPRFLYLQAEALRRLNQMAEAAPLIEQALALNPENEEPHWFAGEMLEELGRLSLAAKEWRAILKIAPEGKVYDINAYLRLTEAYRESGLYRRAADTLTNARNLYVKAREQGEGMGILGGNEQDLLREIERLQRLARQYPGNGKGQIADRAAQDEILITINATVKDKQKEELRQALAGCGITLTMNVQPEGLRLFDKAPATVRFDRAKKELVILLNGKPLCQPVPFSPPQRQPRVAVRTLDCVYIFALDPDTGKAERTARFEKDYKVTFAARGGLAALMDIKITVNGKSYEWRNLLQGVDFDYLPAHMEIRLQGTDRNGRRVMRESKIKTKEPLLFPPEKKQAPKAETAPEAPARIGKVAVFRQSGRAEIAAKVVLTKGILDYLCVLPNSGKEYESLLALDCQAASLHAALLALGARPGSISDGFRFEHRGVREPDGPRQPPGDHVRIMLRWRVGETEHTAPVEKWLIHRATRRAPESLTWVFTGSFFAPAPGDWGRVYMADMEKLAVGMLYHGACVLNVASAAGNPYAGEDKGFEINPNAVPPLGAAVTVIFQAQKKFRAAKKDL